MTRSRKSLPALLLICVGALFSCGNGSTARDANRTGASAAPDATAMFRGGASHAGVYPAAATSEYGGLQWRVQTGSAVRSSPTLAGGVVYVGSSDGLLYALDAQSGAERWKFDAHSPVLATPAVAGNLVFCGARSGGLAALDAATGKLIWTHKAGADAPLAWGHESGDFYTSSPTVSGDKVLYGGGDGFLYALRRADGREAWKLKTGGRVRSTPAVEGATVFVGSFDGCLYAVDLETGQLKWRYETEGAKLNSSEFGYDRRSIQSSPAVADGAVFFGARDGFLYAIEAATGALRWRFDHKISWVNTSPAVVDGMVYAGSSDGRFVQSVDARTGREVWRAKTDSLIWSSPAVAGSMLYTGDWAGNLYGFDRASGREAWRYRGQGRILTSPVVAEGRVYFGGDDGGVYAVNFARGAALKRAVFWDADYAKAASVRNHEALRDYFKADGYQVLNAADLARFFDERASDHAPSVVVFAIDFLPKPLAAGDAQSPLRKYLDAGGKVVWVGVPPALWEIDPKTGDRDIKGLDRAATSRLLGVSHEGSNFDANTARVTDAGRRWGLSGWWLSNWSAEPGAVTTVLAEDEMGLAAAWVRRYGGGEGTGFVRVPLVEPAGGAPTNMAAIKVAAEYLPR
ncbi:MAG: PQQ-binding-like beta-propeller repeat protein [Pyrinomonadaceae bacterium]